MADYDVDRVLGRTKGLDLASLDDLMQVVEQVLETGKLQDRIEKLEHENLTLRETLKDSRNRTNRLQNQLEQANMTNGENADYVARKVEVADELAKRNAQLRDRLDSDQKRYEELYVKFCERGKKLDMITDLTSEGKVMPDWVTVAGIREIFRVREED